MDTVDKAERSRIMSRVRSSGNKSTELAFITILRSNGITGWRRHYKLSGNPDFVFPSRRIAVFIDGCFWHGCPEHCRIPRSHRNYWKAKISRNEQRDRAISRQLRNAGWIVIRFWEHDMRGGRAFKRKLNRLKSLVVDCSVAAYHE